MREKRQEYPAELKARVVLDLLSWDHTLGHILRPIKSRILLREC